MSAFQDLRTSTWAFFEAYGWATVIATIVVYFLYKKYFYDLLRDRNEKKKQSKQEAFNREVHDKESDRIRSVRKRQQEEHDKQEKIETLKRLEKEKEKTERMQRELNERDQSCQTLGHSTPTSSTPLPSTKTRSEHAKEIVEAMPTSATVTVFGQSTCPNFRKICQLLSTYRMDSTKFQVFEFDKQADWPVEMVLELMKTRYGANESPIVFVSGQFIGGLEEARRYDRTHGFENI